MDTKDRLYVLDDDLTVEHDPVVDRRPSPEGGAADLVETVLTRQVRYFVAICAFAGGVLHLLAMAAHNGQHPTLGRAFLGAGIAQIIWGVLLIIEPRRLFVLGGALMTVGLLAAWVFWRTKGISWFPGMEDVAPI
jgi:hypothetical protein